MSTTTRDLGEVAASLAHVAYLLTTARDTIGELPVDSAPLLPAEPDADGEPTQGSVWRHRHDPARRAQVTQVTQTEVETRIVFGPGSFDQSATVARFSRRTWHTWWTPEGAADGGEG